MRTTKAELCHEIALLQKQGYDVAIHWAYGQPRVTEKSEARDISPRLRTGEMSIWLHGFDKGIEAERERTQQLITAVLNCIPDLEHYVGTHGPGPDARLFTLKRIMRAMGRNE